MYPRLEISDLCIKCDACRLLCPENAVLSIENEYIIENWSCTLCNICLEICPASCIKPKTSGDPSGN